MPNRKRTVVSLPFSIDIQREVPGTGVEPALLAEPEPKSGASTNFAIPAGKGRQRNEIAESGNAVLRYSSARRRIA